MTPGKAEVSHQQRDKKKKKTSYRILKNIQEYTIPVVCIKQTKRIEFC